jgi:hypothetical protein
VRRWPTAVALALGVPGLLDGGDPVGAVDGLSEALVLLPLLYLVQAVLDRRRASWAVLGVLGTAFVAVRAAGVVPPASVFAGLALVVLIWGASHGLHRSGMFRVQALGMIAFGALALAGLAVDPQLGRYVVAAGWFLHGLWDWIHLRADKVVARSYAEWCGVLDVLIAAELVFGL